MAQTKDQQVKAVVIGMALGVPAQGVDAVTGAKMSLEFACKHAWQRWSKASHIPSIKGHDRGKPLLDWSPPVRTSLGSMRCPGRRQVVYAVRH